MLRDQLRREGIVEIGEVHRPIIIFIFPPAGMAELVDARDSKSRGGNTMWVRFPLPAPQAQGRHPPFVRPESPALGTNLVAAGM